MRVVVDYKWKAFAQRMHLEWMRMVLWTMMLQRVLSNPTFFDPEATQLPWWEYAVMGFVVVYSISPTLNFCGKLIAVEGWRNLLAVDSAASWVDLGKPPRHDIAAIWVAFFSRPPRHDRCRQAGPAASHGTLLTPF